MVRPLQQWAREIKRDVVAVWIAARDPRVPWYVKMIAALVSAYALSQLDLIPDFVPVLGYIDDLAIVPLGLVFVVKLIPQPLMTEFREEAERREERPSSHPAAVAIVLLWLMAIAITVWWFWPRSAQ